MLLRVYVFWSCSCLWNMLVSLLFISVFGQGIHIYKFMYIYSIFSYILASTFFKGPLLFAQSMFHTPMRMITLAVLFSPRFPFCSPSFHQHRRDGISGLKRTSQPCAPSFCSCMQVPHGRWGCLRPNRFTPMSPLWSLPFAPFCRSEPRQVVVSWFRSRDERSKGMVRNKSIVLCVTLGKGS